MTLASSPLQPSLDPLALTAPVPSTPSRLYRLDLLLLALFCLLLFGYSMFSGRPLSLHEGRLPELSRQMMQSHDFIIPRSGGRPWLERPPLPHWTTIAISTILGQHADSVWVVRLPAALCGLLVVLLTASIAARWYGRWIGLCSGLVLATCYEFYSYSSLAEDDIFLAALVMIAMAHIVRTEFPSHAILKRSTSLLGPRPWSTIFFFIVLGLTNLAKGPLVGATVVIAVLATFLLWTADFQRIRHYLWLWGWLIFAALTVAWPLLVYRRYPEILDLWRFDYAGATRYHEPIWYYPIQLLGALAPWTLFAPLGFWLTRKQALHAKNSPERFLWCWAIIPIIVLSIPHRKHHHYLVPSLAPWAILCAIALRHTIHWLFQRPTRPLHPALALLFLGLPGAAALLIVHARIPGPFWAIILLAIVWLICIGASFSGFWRKDSRLVLAGIIFGIFTVCCWGQSALPDQTTQDTLFLKRADAIVPRDRTLFVNGDLKGELDFFRNSFYLRPQASLLHNLTFLRDQRITSPEVYVITRASDAEKLATLGQCDIILQSTKTRRERTPADRFTLLHLRFHPDLRRYSAPDPATISALQAYGQKDGPFCGPPL